MASLFRKLLPAALLLIFELSCGSTAYATEGGTQHYPIGANTAQPAIMPDLGATVWLNYDQFYSGSSYRNASGQSSIPGYHVSTFGEAARFIHTWNIDVSGWHFSSQVIVTGVNTDLWSGTAFHHASGIGDLNVVPLYVSKNFGDFNLLGGFNVWAPTGSYTKGQVVNASANYATFAPEAAITYHPNARFMASIDAIAMFNSEDNATHYLSGNSLNFDYQAGYRILPSIPQLQLGVSGYYFAQFTNDVSNGITLANGGNRGRVFAIGPQLRVDYSHGAIIFKWQKEMAVMNRPEGNRYWCQFALKL